MALTDQEILQILLRAKYISTDEAVATQVKAAKNKTGIIAKLYEEQLINKDLLGQAVGEFFKLPYYDLNSHPVSAKLIKSFPEDLAKKYELVLISKDDKETLFTTSEPRKEKEILTELDATFSDLHTVKLYYSLTEDVQAAFESYKNSLESRFVEIYEHKVKVAPEILQEIFRDALAHHASDVHIEPLKKEVVIRFRIDGILREMGRITNELYINILNKIKVEAKLRIDQHFSAQDGAIRLEIDNRAIDLRVSIVPVLDGQKVVIRVLSDYISQLSLEQLGLLPEDQKIVENAYKKPFGMIISAGPTGAGKTTTLYSILKLLHKPEVNITTIEDPVEYKVTGVNQIQVNTETDLTFAKGLRSIVRQDPNIILVGEIRDTETAEISVNAALTGHLLLSSFHANDAASVVPRLLDMRIEPFLLASTINLIIAQRLARRICDNCRVSYQIEVKEVLKEFPMAKDYFHHDKTTLYKGKGCSHCNNTGYKGRIGLFEIIEITPELQDLITSIPSALEIARLAEKQGARTFFDDGMAKVKTGITTLTELFRVAPIKPKLMSDTPKENGTKKK